MKNIYSLILFVCLVILSFQTKASHVMGSDLTYRNIDTGVFEIRLVIYRDCRGITVQKDTLFAVTSNKIIDMGFPTLVSRTIVTGQHATCTPIPCSTKGYGVEEWVYLDTVDLSNESNCEWTINWSQCCRNGAITTGASAEVFYNQMSFNKCYFNSSPVYSESPVVYVLEGEDIILSLGVMDTVDGFDSLSFQLVNPQIDIKTSVTFSPSFSAQSPLRYLGFPNPNTAYPGGFRVSPLTGDLLFRPTVANEVAIMAMEVEEWKNIGGTMILMGKTRRDIQIIVDANPSGFKSPYLEDFDYPISTLCEGDTLKIDLISADSNSSDSTYIFWNNSLSGAVWTSTNGTEKNATGQLRWVPPANSARSGPNIVTFTVKDNTCPIARRSARSYFVFVYDSSSAPSVDAGSDIYDNINPIFHYVNGKVKNQPQAPVKWTSSGDGYFENPRSLNTKYYQGTQDKTNCYYELYLDYMDTSLCQYPQSKYRDTIQVFKVSGGINAGVDTSVYASDTLNLEGQWNTFRGQNAFWRTLGDGIFDDTLSKQTRYIPGQNDLLSCEWQIVLETFGYGCQKFIDTVDVKRLVEPWTKISGVSALHGDSVHLVWTGSPLYQQHFLIRSMGDGIFTDTLSNSTSYIPGANDLLQCGTQFIVQEYPLGQCATHRDTVVYTKLLPNLTAGSNIQLFFGDTAQLNALPVATANYQFGYWTTAGDGSFIDSNDAETRYIPGTSDWANCGTTLYWHEIDQACGGRIDSIQILRVTSAVDAGADQAAYYSSSVAFNLLGYSDTANGFQAYWTSTGDGSFYDSFDLNAVYTPGANDLNACLVELSLTEYPIGTCTVYDEMEIHILDTVVQILSIQIDSFTFDTVHLEVSRTINRGVLSWQSTGTGNFVNKTDTSADYVLTAADKQRFAFDLKVTYTTPCRSSSDQITVEPQMKPNGLIQLSSAISLYPNPATNSLRLSWQGNHGDAILIISDILGKELDTQFMRSEDADIDLDIQHLAAGSYVLMLSEVNGQRLLIRFIKK